MKLPDRITLFLLCMSTLFLAATSFYQNKEVSMLKNRVEMLRDAIPPPPVHEFINIKNAEMPPKERNTFSRFFYENKITVSTAVQMLIDAGGWKFQSGKTEVDKLVK